MKHIYYFSFAGNVFFVNLLLRIAFCPWFLSFNMIWLDVIIFVIILLKISRPSCIFLKNSYPLSSEIWLLRLDCFSPSWNPTIHMLDFFRDALPLILIDISPFFFSCFFLDFPLISIVIKSIYWFLNFSLIFLFLNFYLIPYYRFTFRGDILHLFIIFFVCTNNSITGLYSPWYELANVSRKKCDGKWQGCRDFPFS